MFDTFRLRDFESEYERANIEAGDALLTIVGTIGRSAYIGTDKGKEKSS